MVIQGFKMLSFFFWTGACIHHMLWSYCTNIFCKSIPLKSCKLNSVGSLPINPSLGCLCSLSSDDSAYVLTQSVWISRSCTSQFKVDVQLMHHPMVQSSALWCPYGKLFSVIRIAWLSWLYSWYQVLRLIVYNNDLCSGQISILDKAAVAVNSTSCSHLVVYESARIFLKSLALCLTVDCWNSIQSLS